MRIIEWLATSALCLFLSSPVSGDEPARPWIPTTDEVNIYYSGTVTAVTKDSITVRWPGEVPKKFAVSETLAAGEIPKEPRTGPDGRGYNVNEPFRYRLTDVAVGDEVCIAYAHLGDADICDHICIKKRPNGRVPPLPKGAEIVPKLPPGAREKLPAYMFIPYHERMNAYHDLEDRGIPYPEKFGKYRRWPVAPMPREVKVTPATSP